MIAYRDGLFGKANASVRLAACYFIEESASGITLYLEDVKGRHGPSWSLPDYDLTARYLGDYQGGNQVDDKSATDPPKTNAFFVEYLRRRAELVESAGEIMEPTTPYPELEDLRDLIQPLAEMWGRRNVLLQELAKAPIVRSHFDFRCPNLFLDDMKRQLVAIDLAYAGAGSMGHDIANLVADDIFDFFIAPNDLDFAWQNIMTAYLAAVGQYITEEQALSTRAAMNITVALKYAWLIPATFRAARDPVTLKNLESEYGNLRDFFVKRSSGLRLIGRLIQTCLSRP
jgi:hypothetical protein